MTGKDRITHHWLTGDLAAQVTIFLGVLLIYLWSMPRTVVLEDDGLFLLTAYFNGIAHPPGYPLYTLMSHLATFIPLGNIAERVHGFTAMLGATGCVCLYRAIRHLLPGKFYALVASFAFGFSLAFWSQSIIAEVYSLNIVIVMLLFWLSLKYAACNDTAEQQRLLNWMGLIYGLGLSNHWPLLVLSTPLFLTVLLPGWRNLLQQFPRGVLFGLLGLTPYMWMVWRSQLDPLISFYGPINDLQEFWFFISRQMYAEVEHSPTAGWHDRFAFSLFALTETARQFTWAGMVLVITGFLAQWKQWSFPVSLGLTLGYTTNTFILIALLGLDYDYINQSNFRATPLVAYAICGVWLALGLKRTHEWIATIPGQLIRPAVLQKATGLLVIALPLMANTGDNFRAHDTWAEDYARVVLESLDKDAILFTAGDTSVWTIGYVHHVLGVRPDVTVYNMKGVVFSNRLYKPYTLTYKQVEKKVEQFLLSTPRPVYFTSDVVGNYGETDFGIFKQINKNSGKDSQQAVVLPMVRQYFTTLLARGEPVDNWERMHYRILTAQNCLQSIRIAQAGSGTNDQTGWIERICNNFQGKMLHIAYLLQQDFGINQLSGLIDEAENLKYQAIAKSESRKLEEYQDMLRRHRQLQSGQ
jgi:hypothetical protein